MVIRRDPIKKSNKREYIIIEMIFSWEGRKRPTVGRRKTRKPTEVSENSTTADWRLLTSAVQPLRTWKLKITGAIKGSIHEGRRSPLLIRATPLPNVERSQLKQRPVFDPSEGE